MSAPLPAYLAMLVRPCVLSSRVAARDPSDPVSAIRTLPVPSPSKVSVAQWHPGSPWDLYTHPVLCYLDRETGLAGQLGAVSLIQRTGGHRISEVLSLKTTDIVPPDALLIRALKRSRPRVLRLPELQPALALLLQGRDHPLFSISYHQVYRAYLRSGIVLYNHCGSRRSVTHAPRRAFIQAVHRVSKTLDITRDCVGHKSRTSTLTYLKKGS